MKITSTHAFQPSGTPVRAGGEASPEPSDKLTPGVTPLEAEKLEDLRSRMWWGGFKIGVKQVGLKFGAIQGVLVGLVTALTLGVVPGIAVGVGAGGGSALIMGALFAGDTVDKGEQTLVPQWRGIFEREPETTSVPSYERFAEQRFG